jgi:integrase
MRQLIYLPADSKLLAHSWRIGCATRMAERGCPDNWIYQFVGWSDGNQSMKRYTRISDLIKIDMMHYIITHPVVINGVVLR